MTTERKTRWMTLAAMTALLMAGLVPTAASATFDQDIAHQDVAPWIGWDGANLSHLDRPVETDGEPPECLFNKSREHHGDGGEELCPDPVDAGASCVSHALVVVERDASGAIGSVTILDSTSRASTEAHDGPVFTAEATDLQAPANPDAKADAHKAQASYNRPGLAVDAGIVESRCEVAAHVTDGVSGPGFLAAAFGQARVEDLSVQLGANGIQIQSLERTIDAVSIDGDTRAGHGCEIVDLTLSGTLASLVPPWLVTPGCPPANTGIQFGPASFAFNERWGPVTSGSQTYWGGSVVHLSLPTGTGSVDVYVGYTAVSVHGQPAQ